MIATIYIDPIFYHCSRIPSENAIVFETGFFIGKCDTFVEGHYAVPDGYTLTLPGGKILHGERIAPWKDYSELEAAQAQYERDHAELQASYKEGVNSAYD